MGGLQIDRRRFLGGVGASLALTGFPAARSMAFRSPASAWPSVEAFVPRFVADHPIPGALIALGRGQAAPEYFADGVTALGSAQPVDANTLWRIYSMTKPVTGMATMLLVEDGVIGLDQNIADFLPAFAEPRVLTDPDNSLETRPASGPITIRHLLTHTAGLGYTIITTGPLLAEYRRLGLEPGVIMHEEPEIVARRPQSLEEFANRLATLPIIADPGTKWSYSVSLDLLGRIIEIASGMPFDTFLQQRIFTPLDMRDTIFQVPAEKTGRMTASYTIRDGAPVLVDPAEGSVYAQPPRYPYGGAGLVSSARDYDRFLTMLLGEGALGDVRIMDAETARLAMSDLLPADVDKTDMYYQSGFGAGGRVTTEPGAAGEGIGTYGWGGAAGTVAWVDRANNLRASGYVQNLPSEVTPFRAGVLGAVYADLYG
ncbi:serine hydrolase domain-containing protein [Parasphingopyxis lamellibrachiae]|uniref:CubicO group peptidase (Beta-lactamase class C family) n=1 Tax=Parasphingopyxis lamellibrachiae TaxID=680125 RepID=A0A3D9FH74_9SPHN|nr:serine hydrolase domain-containing protein [Parasphingopyxis lamellibrachiae]RED17144.1 CubicO group peptidase (beta-lactamase class C family) [Parasphingopyxis lamellibrachiae]